MCGFRAFRVAVLKKALTERNGDPLLSRDGWAANLELLLAVAPFTRRVEGAEIGSRNPRKQRETRFRSWDTLVQVWEVGRQQQRRPPTVPSTDTAG